MRWTPTRQQARSCIVIALLLVVTATPIGAVAVGPEEEPNNGRDAAQEIAVGEEVTGELTSGDVDYFQFTADRGQAITISAATDDVGTTNFELLDPAGNQLASISGLTASSAQTGAIASNANANTYYLRVERRFTDRGGAYNFTITTRATDDFEPNEIRRNATEIIDEEEVEGELTMSDTDWFSVTASAGDQINVTAFADANGSTNVQLYDRNGTLLTGQDGLTGARAEFNYTATYDGTYAVRVAPRFGQTFGASYNLTVDLPGEPPANDTGAGPDDDADDESDTDSGGGGLPVVPILAAVAVALVIVLVVVWRGRDDDSQ